MMNNEIMSIPKFDLIMVCLCCLCSVPVTLDPNTANSYLILSDNILKLPDNPEIFDDYKMVLAYEGFNSGIHDEVGHNTGHFVGVITESCRRKGDFSMCRGSWGAWFWKDRYLTYVLMVPRVHRLDRLTRETETQDGQSAAGLVQRKAVILWPR